MLEPQRTLTVTAGASTGTPPMTELSLAALGPTPACQALPKTVWSITSGVIPERFIDSLTAAAPSSGAVRFLSDPPNCPPIVRAAPSITTSLICYSQLFPQVDSQHGLSEAAEDSTRSLQTRSKALT